MTIELRKSKALARYEELANQSARDAEVKAAARRKAVGDTIELWLAGRTEQQRAAFFAEIEAAASARNRKTIATHPMRPEMTAAVAEVMAAAAAVSAGEVAPVSVKAAPVAKVASTAETAPVSAAAEKGLFDQV